MNKLPIYLQYKDLDNRFARRLAYFTADKVAIYFAKTSTDNWYAICKLSDSGETVEPLWEMYLGAEKYIDPVHDLLRKWCREHGLAFMGKHQGRVPRLEHDPKKQEQQKMKEWMRLAQ
jgi:hypothetical protein